jgi:ABC-type branched-subunit amino acid transport system ATPase component
MSSTPLIEHESRAVETRDLGKWFGARAALDGVDLDVPRGCAFGFLGANGAGKTTLIRLLLGLAEPTSGRMRLLGRDLPADRAVALAGVGAIIEEPRFHPHLTGRENLRLHAAARDRPAHKRIDGALARAAPLPTPRLSASERLSATVPQPWVWSTLADRTPRERCARLVEGRSSPPAQPGWR